MRIKKLQTHLSVTELFLFKLNTKQITHLILLLLSFRDMSYEKMSKGKRENILDN